MASSEYRILLLTSDRYDRAVLPYAHLLKKHWSDHPDVLVAGFTPPDFNLPERFTFHSIGRFEDYPIHKWSDALIKLLGDIPDEVFILTLEDMWLTHDVDTRVIKMCYDYMMQFEYVARLDLTGDRLNAGDASFYGWMGDIRLIWSNPGGQYHLSMMPAFWRKRHLRRVLVPGETPWQVELEGTPRLGSFRNEMIVLGTDAWPIKNLLAFRSGNSGELLLDELSEEDRDGLYFARLLDPWGVD